jgi:hypothetical protein
MLKSKDDVSSPLLFTWINGWKNYPYLVEVIHSLQHVKCFKLDVAVEGISVLASYSGGPGFKFWSSDCPELCFPLFCHSVQHHLQPEAVDSHGMRTVCCKWKHSWWIIEGGWWLILLFLSWCVARSLTLRQLVLYFSYVWMECCLSLPVKCFVLNSVLCRDAPRSWGSCDGAVGEQFVRFQVLTATSMKMTAFWDEASFSLEE